ncbi:hypothetical protein HK405_009900 [Cladochytrium tenue]|nr:hypothetical protein HK405_009900 [Cladochytrium tenue]
MVKILAVGSLVGVGGGGLRAALAKIATINAKHGPFAAVLCTGDFFSAAAPPATASDTDGAAISPDHDHSVDAAASAGTGLGVADAHNSEADKDVAALLAGDIKVPVSTYIISGGTPLPAAVLAAAERNHGEICPNLVLLGSEGVYHTTDGIRIAYLGARYDPATFHAGPSPTDHEGSAASFSQDAVARLLTSAAPPPQQPLHPHAPPPATPTGAPVPAASVIDILLTHDWPLGVARGSPAWAARLAAADAATADHLAAAAAGAPPLADIVARLRPRYHFAAAPRLFFEREPIVHTDAAGRPAAFSRFIGLGAFGSPSKERWFYAFNLVPAAEMDKRALTEPPPNSTPSPFERPSNKRPVDDEGDDQSANFFFSEGRNSAKKRKGPPDTYVCNICHERGHWIKECPRRTGPSAPGQPRSVPEGYVCNICNVPGHFIRDCPARAHQQQQQMQQHPHQRSALPFPAGGVGSGAVPPDGYLCKACRVPGHFFRDCPGAAGKGLVKRSLERELGGCWFCLSNPQLEKHLLVDIGDEAYLALAKGGLSDWGGHVIMVPMGHIASRRDLAPPPGSPDVSAVVKELQAYRERLRLAYLQKGMVPFLFEVFSGSASVEAVKGLQHMHVQAVPIPSMMAAGTFATIKALAEADGYAVADGDALPADPTAPYFRLELPAPDGHIARVAVLTLPPGVSEDPAARDRWNVQFPRKALCSLLGCPERLSWRRCVVAEADEAAQTRQMRALLKLPPSTQ